MSYKAAVSNRAMLTATVASVAVSELGQQGRINLSGLGIAGCSVGGSVR